MTHRMILNKGIYNGLLKDMQDAFYEDMLDDPDTAPSYSEWYDVRSDVYNFYYDMRGELWEDEYRKDRKNFGRLQD
ncbi:MAG: hypothetical protein IJ325_09010 [Clostridia bacterium]|nr:hypothetical protein [Clostridia bacterium]